MLDLADADFLQRGGLACEGEYTLFYKQHFCNQKSKQMRSNTLRLKFCYLKTIFSIHILIQM